MQSLEQFFAEASVLIVDPCLASRVALRESLVEMGVKAECLSMAKSLSEAQAALSMKSMQIILSDYRLGDGIGLSLAQQTKRESIFILVSGDSSQAAIAKAAEEEVDDFLLKPYSYADLKQVLTSAIQRRLAPDPQSHWLSEGKRLLSEGVLDAAVIQFEKTKTIRTTFASACAYLAQVRKLQREIGLAKAEYLRGLEENDVHFRCLNGLYEVLLQQKSVPEAYQALKNLVLAFPEHPERLSVAVSLAIHTRNFHDVDVFYEVFQKIYQKTPSLVNHLSSALSVTGRYHLMKKRPEAALERFESAVEVSDGQPKFLSYIANHLSQAGYPLEAEKFLDRHLGRVKAEAV